MENTFGIVQPNAVADEAAIRKVIAANEQAITDNDVETYAITFAEDAHVKWWDKEVTGRQAIKEYFIQQQGKEVLRDVIVNLVINIKGNEATTIGSGLIIRAKQVPSQLLATAGIYTNLKKVDGVWYISFQEKRADSSFDPRVGTLADVVERLKQELTINKAGSSEESSVSAVEERLRAAVLGQDSEALQNILTDNFTGIGFAGQHVNKEGYLKVHANSAMPFRRFDVTHEKLWVKGDVATITGVQDVEANIRLKSRYIGIYQREANEWKLSYWQETGIVDPKLFG